jgi:hypothetical protein
MACRSCGCSAAFRVVSCVYINTNRNTSDVPRAFIPSRPTSCSRASREDSRALALPQAMAFLYRYERFGMERNDSGRIVLGGTVGREGSAVHVPVFHAGQWVPL